jgi:carbonic anhydrase
MSFLTAVNCMDGRVQLPIISYLKERFGVSYVDVVTEAGPVRPLAEGQESREVESIVSRVNVSIQKHKSKGIAVVAHHDCAGNPAPEARQHEQLHAAVDYLASRYPASEVIGLWVDGSWIVHEVCARDASAV